MYSIVVKKTYELLRNIWIPSLKWRHLAQYNTDIIGRLYQTIEKKGPVFAECLLKSTILLWQWRLYMEFIQANMTTVVVNIVVSINTNWLAKCSSNHIKNECEGFIMGSKHRRETDESTRLQARCFYCFKVFGTLDEARSTSFWDDFSNETIKNYAVIHFFLFMSSPNERTIIHAAMQSCHIT